MSDILLVAVNSSFSHTNIAVRYLKYYADRFLCSTCTTQGGCDSDIPKGECDKAVVPAGNFDSGPMQGDLSGGADSPIQFFEFTINQPLGEIIRGINSQNPKIILFSTYIWNIETVVRIAKNIKALRPEIVVAAGGPEAGFRGSDFLKENPDFDFVMKGEGEETFRQIVEREKASAVPVPQGEFVLGAQHSAAAPAGDLGFVSGAQQCAVPQGDFVPGAQQCGASVPQGEFVLGAQQCGSSQGDSDLSHGATPAGDLGFVPGTQQCAIPQGNALSAKQCAAAPQGDLDGVISAQQCGTSQGDSDLSHGATPAGDLGFVPGAQQCGIPQGNALGAQQCGGSVPQGEFVLGAQQCAGSVPQGCQDCRTEKSGNWREEFLESLKNVKGLYLRNPSHKNDITFTGDQELICDMGTIPFPYPDLEKMDVDHKIFYYESSRGCPFSCAYCMSSLDTKVRFVPLEKVYADLQRFLDAGVKLVKFVDRTYNLKPERYVGIWKYIMEHHNGKTMFHFEIEGEFLSEEAMEFLQTVPEGIMQFEIGVQSSNPVVLKACGRSPETKTLRENILRIPKTIHTHLDLIAGLPFEDLESFGRSFDFVMSMEPDALQLGFLKVLYGAPVNSFCGSEPGWKWMKTPPYEILETPYLSYDEILFLKDLETALDAYWNDHHFDTVMRYLAWACYRSRHGDLGAAFQAGDMPVAPQGNALGTRQCGVAPQGNASGAQHCAAAPQGDFDSGALDNAPSAQHCGTSQGNASGAQHCAATLKGDSDLSHGAAWWKLFVSLTKWLRTQDAFSSAHQKDYWAQMLHEYLESQEDVAHHGGFVLTAQQSGTTAPQGDLDSGDLDNAPGTQQCAIPQGNASSAQQCGTSQGDSDLSHCADAPASDFDSGDLDAAPTAQQCAAVPAGALDNAPGAQQCAIPQGNAPTAQQCSTPAGALGNAPGAQQCTAAPASALDNASSPQQCAIPQGNAPTAQQCGTPQGDSDLSHCAAAPQGNAPGAQQCTAAPASDFDSGDLDNAPTAQQCGTPSGDFDSGDLDNALSSSQCNVARELLRFDYIAGGKKTNPPAWLRRNYDDQGHYDALQNTTGIKHSRLDFVYSDFDTFSVNPLDPATWHAAPAAPSGDLDNAMSAQHCHAVPQGDPDNVGRSQQGVTYSVLFLYARKESDRPTDFQRVPHQILIH